MPSGAQPVLYTAAGGAPDQLDTTVDYTGANRCRPAPRGAGRGLLTAPANPGGTGWQLKVFVQNQASSQLFVDGLTAARPGTRGINIGAYPAAPASSYAALAESGALARPGAPGAAAGHLLGHPRPRPADPPRPAPGHRRGARPDPAALGAAGQPGPVDRRARSGPRQSASKVVLFAYDEGTEGVDRGGSDQAAGLPLPGYQDDLIAAVAAANPNTVVVLNTGDPVLMPWVSAVRSVLEMWYPGQEGGPATADVLLGKADPGGKLPVTFPASATRFPRYDPNCTDTSVTGNCPLYPGVAGPARSSPVPRPVTAPSPAWRSTGSTRGTAGTTSTTWRRCSPSGTACRTPGSPTRPAACRRRRDGGIDVRLRVTQRR